MKRVCKDLHRAAASLQGGLPTESCYLIPAMALSLMPTASPASGVQAAITAAAVTAELPKAGPAGHPHIAAGGMETHKSGVLSEKAGAGGGLGRATAEKQPGPDAAAATWSMDNPTCWAEPSFAAGFRCLPKAAAAPQGPNELKCDTGAACSSSSSSAAAAGSAVAGHDQVQLQQACTVTPGGQAESTGCFSVAGRGGLIRAGSGGGTAAASVQPTLGPVSKVSEDGVGRQQVCHNRPTAEQLWGVPDSSIDALLDSYRATLH
jgi:hypothetical protein